MAKKETNAYNAFKKAVAGRLALHRIENRVGESMPDVVGQNKHGCTFWLENKHIDDWPARASTFPLRGHFEAGQLAWGRAWMSNKGYSFVLLRVGREFYLLNPLRPLDEMTKQQLVDTAITETKIGIIEYLEELR